MSKPFTFGSVCSGIEAASVAWHPLGWRAAFFSEIEPFPSRVLAQRWPDVPNLGDMTKFQDWPDYAIDLLVGGTPCQSFSVSGLRKGLADPRGNLMLTYLAIAARYRPRWLVWENVPGVLSSNGGRDFGTFLGGLGELGYGFAYRVLDAQYVRVESHPRAVPQRRRRVFVVGHLGDWRRAAAVLLERESLCGYPAPRREAGKRSACSVAPCLAASGRGFERTGDTRGQDCLVPEVCGCLSDGAQTEGFFDEAYAIQAGALRENPAAGPDGVGVQASVAYTVEARAEVQAVAFNARQDPDVSGGVSGPIDTDGGTQAVAFGVTIHGTDKTQKVASIAEVSTALRARAPGHRDNSSTTAVLCGTESSARPATDMAVRRLTPRECERLQGFQDDYARIPMRTYKARRVTKNRPADMWDRNADGTWTLMTPDGPRYKALGNSMACNVMRWIGERIQQLETLCPK